MDRHNLPRPKRTFQKSRSSQDVDPVWEHTLHVWVPAMVPLGTRGPTPVLLDEQKKKDEDRQVDRQDVAAGFQFGPSAEVRHQEDTFPPPPPQSVFTRRPVSPVTLCQTTCKEPRDWLERPPSGSEPRTESEHFKIKATSVLLQSINTELPDPPGFPSGRPGPVWGTGTSNSALKQPSYLWVETVAPQ